MTENEISYKLIGAALDIHSNVGPGLLESAYETALVYELRQIGFSVKQQVPRPFIYKEIKMDIGYRMDILIENKVIVEVKAIDSLAPVHFAQLLTYLKLSNIKLGLLINFNCTKLKDNIHRIANNL